MVIDRKWLFPHLIELLSNYFKYYGTNIWNLHATNIKSTVPLPELEGLLIK